MKRTRSRDRQAGRLQALLKLPRLLDKLPLLDRDKMSAFGADLLQPHERQLLSRIRGRTTFSVFAPDK